MRLDRVALALGQAYVFGKGFAADLPFGVTAFLKTRPQEPIPDVQLLFWMGATNTASPYLPPFKKAFADSFSCRAMPMRPTSRGHVELASADPKARHPHPPELPRPPTRSGASCSTACG